MRVKNLKVVKEELSHEEDAHGHDEDFTPLPVVRGHRRVDLERGRRRRLLRHHGQDRRRRAQAVLSQGHRRRSGRRRSAVITGYRDYRTHITLCCDNSLIVTLLPFLGGVTISDNL